MPLKRCSDNGWKWGNDGKCYTGKNAKKQAIKQGIAIEGPKKFSEMAKSHEFPLTEEDIEYILECSYAQCHLSFSEGSMIATELFSIEGWTEDLTEENFFVPASEDYYEGYDSDEDVEEHDAASLWENIRRKKMREGDNYKPAKKGDKDRPDPEAWKRAQSKELQKDVYDNPGEAMKRAKELGLDGIHDHPSKKEEGKKVYMPGKTHDEYEKALREEMSKAEADSTEAARFIYENTKTGEQFIFNRMGTHKKDGKVLRYVGKASEAEVKPIVEEKEKGPKHTSFVKKNQVTAPPTITWQKAAEYKGRKVTLNKPFRTPGGPKKSAVYTKNEKGNVVLVRFGDPNMKIKKNIPERRKNFRARHNCSNPGPKWKARYWSCRAW